MSNEGAATVPVLLFDGDCAFCTSSVRWARRAIRRMPRAEPYQLADLDALGLTTEECATAVRYVARDHHVYVAHDAVSALLLGAGGGWWVLGASMRLPGVHWLSGLAYRAVARNRHRLPGGTAACAVPLPEALSDRG